MLLTIFEYDISKENIPKYLNKLGICMSNKYKNRYNDYNNSYNQDICGIINLGNNCYLNSGLQILASCRELVHELAKTSSGGSNNIIPYIKNALDSLLSKNMFDPRSFMDHFCSRNSDFIRGAQCCSQNFIRTVITNINKDLLLYSNSEKVSEYYQYGPSGREYQDYQKFIRSERIFPETKIQSIFSGMTKSFSKGTCKYCHRSIENYSFNYFIDLNLYLDDCDSRCKFTDVLDSNIGNEVDLSLNCPYCQRNINIKEETKFIKLPDILIFTLERYQGETNNVRIKPSTTIHLDDYIDDNLKCNCTEYELFAINIRYGKSANYGHEICQVKRDGVWYEINDRHGQRINGPSNEDSSYGLFYRKAKTDSTSYYIPSYAQKTKEKEKEEPKEKSKEKTKGKMEEEDSDVHEIRQETKKLEDKKEKKESNCCGLSTNLYASASFTPNNYENKTFLIIKNNGEKYMDPGLQIMAMMDEFKLEIKNFIDTQQNKSKLVAYKIHNALDVLRNAKGTSYDATELKNIPFKEKMKEKNSQAFIINTIYTINDEITKNKLPNIKTNATSFKYETHIQNPEELKQFQKYKTLYNNESKAFQLFTYVKRLHDTGKCPNCKAEYNEYIFNHIICVPIKFEYTNNKLTYSFSEILKDNIKKNYKIKKPCKKCQKDIKSLDESSKRIQLPKILIFSIIKSQGNPYQIGITPDIQLDMDQYITSSVQDGTNIYELFAVNIMKREYNTYTYYCQIKKDKKWYEVKEYSKEINSPSFNSDICGLFYRKKF